MWWWENLVYDLHPSYVKSNPSPLCLIITHLQNFIRILQSQLNFLIQNGKCFPYLIPNLTPTTWNICGSKNLKLLTRVRYLTPPILFYKSSIIKLWCEIFFPIFGWEWLWNWSTCFKQPKMQSNTFPKEVDNCTEYDHFYYN